MLVYALQKHTAGERWRGEIGRMSNRTLAYYNCITFGPVCESLCTLAAVGATHQWPQLCTT